MRCWGRAANNGDLVAATEAGGNGSVRATMFPLNGSPLIDAIPAGSCSAAPELDLDQRGIDRPFGAGCDIGAIEAVFPAHDRTDVTPFYETTVRWVTSTVNTPQILSGFVDGTFGQTLQHHPRSGRPPLLQRRRRPRRVRPARPRLQRRHPVLRRRHHLGQGQRHVRRVPRQHLPTEQPHQPRQLHPLPLQLRRQPGRHRRSPPTASPTSPPSTTTPSSGPRPKAWPTASPTTPSARTTTSTAATPAAPSTTPPRPPPPGPTPWPPHPTCSSRTTSPPDRSGVAQRAVCPLATPTTWGTGSPGEGVESATMSR